MVSSKILLGLKLTYIAIKKNVEPKLDPLSKVKVMW